ncbi:MAG: hypothetical protein JO007_17745 [Alphaproteobacteria bacterium]|nr:hypothetical protein [Alphaproteobacteria bacterium]
MAGDGPKDYDVGYGKPPVATRFKKGNRANPHGRPRGSSSLAGILQRALDAPVVAADGKRRQVTMRELMVRSLVERSAGADLAATKLLFELLRKADPRAVAPEPEQTDPLAEDALRLLKERLARLASAQMAEAAAAAPADTVAVSLDPSDQSGATDPTDMG